MNLKRILSWLKNTLVIVLTMILMAGATGFSYQAHYCHDKLFGIVFYPELGLQKSVSCGCADDNVTNQPATGNTTTLRKNSCCSNIAAFRKLSVESPVNDFSIAAVQLAVISIFIDSIKPVVSVNETISRFDFEFIPPPLAGKDLVLFLSQQRIPSAGYNC